MAWPHEDKDIETWITRAPCCVCGRLTHHMDKTRSIAVCSQDHSRTAKTIYPEITWH